MILLVIYAPLAAGLLCLLLKRGHRTLPVVTYLITAAAAVSVILKGMTLHLHLVDSYGISLLLDQSAAWFLLLNAVVSLAITLHEKRQGRRSYFFILLVMLHGCMNACFLSGDLFNLFVVIELTTIVAFLLMSQGMTTKHLWNALRYLFLSNVGMLFFLLGTLLVYESSGNFSLASAAEATPTARAMIVTGLLVKGGVFLPGLWLPQAHAEAEATVSALLSGVVVKIGLLPLIRLEFCSPDLEHIIRSLAFGGVFIGLALAFFQRDVKRLLACSTISQVGFILISPVVGPMYAFAHGIAKACLFFCAGQLPDRDLRRLREKGIERPVAWPMVLAALSIAGCPLLLGFQAKYAVGKTLTGWSEVLAIIASVGTAALLAPILLLPWKSPPAKTMSSWHAPALLSLMLFAGGVFAGPWSAAAGFKAIGSIVAGGLLHILLTKKLMSITLPDGWEKFEHVVGLTCMVLILIIMAVSLP